VLYGLQMNGGVAAFRIDPAGIFEGTYYVGAEGTGPGGADPDFASLAEALRGSQHPRRQWRRGPPHHERPRRA
jgi:hypothetical protein